MLHEVKAWIRALPAAQAPLAVWRGHRLRRMRARAARRALPESISIELTNDCNLKCAKCPTYDAKRSRGFMSEALYRKILEDIRRARCETGVALSGGGEAILHPQIVDFLRQARAVPTVRTLGFATNALDLTPKLSRQLLAAGLNRLKISLDAADATAYLKMNRVDGYARVVDNITEFCRQNDAAGHPCPVTLKVTMYTNDESIVDRLREQWLERVDDIKVTGLHNWVGLRGKRRGPVRDTSCELLWMQMQILWDGQITLCCFDSMEGFFDMGNAAEVDIAEYWQRGAGLAAVRAAHLRRDFSSQKVCGVCNQDQYFTRLYLHNRHRSAPGTASADGFNTD